MNKPGILDYLSDSSGGNDDASGTPDNVKLSAYNIPAELLPDKCLKCNTCPVCTIIPSLCNVMMAGIKIQVKKCPYFKKIPTKVKE